MGPKIYRVITHGGLGDILLSTPAIKALRKKEPGAKIFIYCSRKSAYDIFKNNPYVDKVQLASLSTTPMFCIRWHFKWGKFYDFFYSTLHPGLFCDKNAMDLIAESGYNVELEDRRVQIFLTPAEEKAGREQMSQYIEPVVIHTTSRCSKNQEWPLENWNKLVRSMPEYTFIQLGEADENKVEGAVDLRGKTSFRETFALIKYARSFIGVNSSLSHVTNAYDVPGVVLFGPSPPVIWGHPNNINLYKPVRCAPCIDLILGASCPYGKPCMYNITVQDVKNALLQQIESAHSRKRYTSLAGAVQDFE